MSLQGNGRIGFVNTLRGFAAVGVMLSHYLGFYGPGREIISAITTLPPLSLECQPVPLCSRWLGLVSWFNLPGFCVALFFLISGFVIPFSLQNLSRTGFVMNRLFRIVPTYVAGFAVTLCMLYAGTSTFSVPWSYSLREVLIHFVPGIRDLLWSRHIDFIVWTLEVELKFYFVCMVLLVGFRKQALSVFVVPLLLFVSAASLYPAIPGWEASSVLLYRIAIIYATFALYTVFMFIGVVFHYLYIGRICLLHATFACTGLYILFHVLWATGPYADSAAGARSYGAAMLAFSLAYAFPRLFGSNRLFIFFADISYPLYVIHGVAGYVVLRMLGEIGVPSWLAIPLVVSLCMFVAWLLHVYVESPTQRFGKTLGKKISRCSDFP